MFRRARRKTDARRGLGVAAMITTCLTIATVTPARAGDVAGAIAITRIRLTDQHVLRIKAIAVCPNGFAVTPSLPPRANATQQTLVYPSSQSKKFGPIVCDGTWHDVLVRFVKPRHPPGAQWESGALTHVTLTFQASRENPYLFVIASETQTVTV